MRVGVSLPVRELREDLGAIRAFAQAAEELGFTHLRIPDQIARKDSRHLHEPLTLLAWIAASTTSIELVPSVIVLPPRQTVLFARQAAGLDVVSGGRLRLGIGLGSNRREYAALGQDYRTRGRRCSEQMLVLRQLWTQSEVSFDGEYDHIDQVGLNPLPIQQPIPMWIGGASVPAPSVLRRIGRHADGWFALCAPEQVAELREQIEAHAREAGRDPKQIGAESGVGLFANGPRSPEEWIGLVEGRRATGITHLCMRTLGGQLDAEGHLRALREVRERLEGRVAFARGVA